MIPDAQMNNAIVQGDMQLADKAVNRGADINDALVKAVKNGRLEIAKLLLERGANPNGTALAVAIDGEVKQSGQEYRYRLKNVPAAGPIFVAIDNGNLDMVRLLLDHGAQPTRPCAVSSAFPGSPVLSVRSLKQSVRYDKEYMRKHGFNVDNLPEYYLQQGENEVIVSMVNPSAPRQAVIKTAIEYVADKGNSHIVEILKKTAEQYKGDLESSEHEQVMKIASKAKSIRIVFQAGEGYSSRVTGEIEMKLAGTSFEKAGREPCILDIQCCTARLRNQRN
jgi:hypothetical protein